MPSRRPVLRLVSDRRPLKREEAFLWHMWRLATENVMNRVSRDITQATGLERPELTVLLRLVDFGRGELRQHELADLLHLTLPRMSRLLREMEKRGFVRRRPQGGKSVLVEVTESGREALSGARPILGASVRRHFLSQIEKPHRSALLAVCKQLAGFNEPEDD